VVRLSDPAVANLVKSWNVTSWLGRLFGSNNSAPAGIKSALVRGLFVCEGKTSVQNPKISVKETYFYFTQNFTEGDMLDQSDLYNHPWALELRGMRDFVVFSNAIRAQGVANLSELVTTGIGLNQPKAQDWAMEQLAQAYRNVLPSFPGIYTVLDKDTPDMDGFALNQIGQQLSKIDMDPLKEVNHPSLLFDESRQQVEMARPQQ
jgi:hypothetical protein